MQAYTPTAVKNFQGLSAGSIRSGARAQARHGIASGYVSLNSSQPRQLGLHPMDLALRQSEGPLVRDEFLKETESDLHDAVRRRLIIIIHLTDYHLRRQLLIVSLVVSR